MMSSIDLVISAEAELDIDSILAYTYRMWGSDQENTYRAILWRGFNRIRDFPEIGHQVSGDRPHIRELVLEYHTILYRYQDNTVTILRIVNPRRQRR